MNRPATVCPQCRALNCTVHNRHKRSDQYRGTPAERGYDAAWQRVRRVKVNRDPLCEICKVEGKVSVVEEVHHGKPVSEYPELRLVMENLWSLCRMHHRLVESGSITLPPAAWLELTGAR